jgi:hypothetical protein
VTKDNVKGHIFSCFLAVYLVVVLRMKIAALGRTVEWDDLILDLSKLRAIGLQLARSRSPRRSSWPCGTAALPLPPRHPDDRDHRPRHPGRLPALRAAAPRVLGLSPLEDQRLGGAIMWIPGTIVPLVVHRRVLPLGRHRAGR